MLRRVALRERAAGKAATGKTEHQQGPPREAAGMGLRDKERAT
jgi:hypothetical protein